MMKKAFCLMTSLALFGCPYVEEQSSFTPEEVAESEALLRRGASWTPERVDAIRSLADLVDSENYRFQLPVFRGQRIVGTQTIGRLPVTEVERLASYRGVEYDRQANAQSVIWVGLIQQPGGAPPPPPTSNGGCQSDHSTPAAGHDLGNRVRDILANIDSSLYFYLN